MKKRNGLWRLASGALVLCAALAAVGCSGEIGASGKNKTKEVERMDYRTELFGENVYIFSPEDDMDQVSRILRMLGTAQETNQFGSERYAIYFMPGEYPDLSVNVGYYMQVSGLGEKPTDVKLGALNCDADWLGDESNHNATCNFWRGVENLEVTGNSMWAVSQATYMRRVQIDGNLSLHDNYGWASGGFLSDSRIAGYVDSGSQQQWLSRNNEYESWMGENWNMVFLGDGEGAPTETWPVKTYTNVGATEEIREKPFLVYDEEQGYCVYVPDYRTAATGCSWMGEETKGKWISIDDFYVAKAAVDTADTMNEALANGKHLLLTPGIYEISSPIRVERENAIVLGMGLATLKSMDGACCMETSDEAGMIISGILFDAGETEAENLMVVGNDGESTVDFADETVDQADPIALSDLFFRIGGCKTNRPCRVKCALTINASDVVGDNFWIWRADHTDQVGWDMNTAQNGLIVNGDDVSLYALMVEHFEEYQTIWNGNDGRVVMYQSEIPYDVPNANQWVDDRGEFGYASFYVTEHVTDFAAYGVGIYLYNRDTVAPLISAMRVPDTEGVSVTNIITVVLNGNPGIRYVVNEAGNIVMNVGETAKVLYYCNGEWR